MANSKWVLDAHHSEVQFKVKHLMITNVTGQFKVVEASIESEGDNFTNAKVSFTADAASVDTGSEARDNHLRGADFFNSAEFPSLKFEAQHFNQADGQVEGQLTIRDVTKPVTLDVEYLGTNTDPYGNLKAGFSLSGKINRTDWNLNWNASLEAGGLLVSEEVRLLAEVQFAQQAA